MALKEAFTIGVVLSAKDLYSRQFAKAQTDLKRLSRTAKDEAAKYERSLKFGKRMAIAGGMVVAASHAISNALEGMEQQAVDLDQALANVSTVLEDTGRLPEFKGVAMNAAAKSMFNSSQFLNEGAYNLLSAGLSVDEALAILPRVGQLAVGTFDEIQGATNNATTVMMAYKSVWKDLSAEEKAIKTTDALARAIQLFKYVGPELAVTLQYAAASAAAANAPLEDMLATIGVMKSAGLEASMAGTSYRMMLEKLPAVHKKTGIAVADATGRMRPLVEILTELKKRYGDVLTVAELEEISKMFDVRAAGGVKALLMNLDELEKRTGEMHKAGAAWEMYERRMAGAGATMQALRNEYADASALLATKMIPVMRTKQELLTKAVKTIERIPAAKEVLAGASIAAELGKLAGPLITAIGLWKIYHTQQKIALALQAQLTAATTTTAAAGGAGAATKGAAAAAGGGAAIGLPEILLAAGAGFGGFKLGEKVVDVQRKLGRRYARWAGQRIAGVLGRGRPKMGFEMPVPAEFRGVPFEAMGSGVQEYGTRPGALALERAGPSTVTIEGGITINLQGTGSSAEDARRIALRLAPELGKAMQREARRHP